MFRILFMTCNELKISIWVIRKFETSDCIFLALVTCRAKKQLASCDQLSPASVKAIFAIFRIQWGWGITGQKITRQSTSDWLKMTSPRTSKSNSGDLSRF